MRIISGKNKGRKIIAPAGLPVRPTTDMAKESLFNILNNHFDFETLHVLDLFTGTGNMAYEFVSRGCPVVTAVDLDAQCIRFVKQTAEKLGYSELTPIQADYQHFVKRTHATYDLIFADPPYQLDGIEQVPELLLELNLLKPGGWIVLEHDKHIDFSSLPAFIDHRKYGKVNFSMFQSAAQP